MKIEFTCRRFEDLTFDIEGVLFKYTECEIMAERESNALPVIDLILKSPDGMFAEILICSYDVGLGKRNFQKGFYVGQLVNAIYAEECAALTNAFS